MTVKKLTARITIARFRPLENPGTLTIGHRHQRPEHCEFFPHKLEFRHQNGCTPFITSGSNSNRPSTVLCRSVRTFSIPFRPTPSHAERSFVSSISPPHQPTCYLLLSSVLPDSSGFNPESSAFGVHQPEWSRHSSRFSPRSSKCALYFPVLRAIFLSFHIIFLGSYATFLELHAAIPHLHAEILGIPAAILEHHTAILDAHTVTFRIPGTSLSIPVAIPRFPATFLGVLISILGVPSTFLDVPDSILGVAAAIRDVPERFLHVHAAFRRMPSPFHRIPRPFLSIHSALFGIHVSLWGIDRGLCDIYGRLTGVGFCHMAEMNSKFQWNKFQTMDQIPMAKLQRSAVWEIA